MKTARNLHSAHKTHIAPRVSPARSLISLRIPWAAGAVVLVSGLLAACTPVPPEGQEGGDSTPGGNAAGNGGSSGSGTIGGGAGSGGSSGGISGSAGGIANVRFCNGLLNDPGSGIVELTIGNTKLSAVPGKCANTCGKVATGLVRAVLRRDGKQLHDEELAFQADEHYGFLALLDAKTRGVSLVGGHLDGGECQLYEPFSGGTSSSGPKTFGKFCHELEAASDEVELELFIGDFSLKAWTGGCSTNNMQLCPLIPAGNQTLKLVSGGRVIANRNVMLDPTREYLFFADLDDTTSTSPSMPTLSVEALDGRSCVAAGIAPPPPAGTPSLMKFCNALPSGRAEITTMDGVKFSAAAGQCAPAKGMTCSKVASGDVTMKVTIDGQDIGEAEIDIPPGADFVLRLFEDGLQKQFEFKVVPRTMMCSAYEWK
jgi:hypothetical protein